MQPALGHRLHTKLMMEGLGADRCLQLPQATQESSLHLLRVVVNMVSLVTGNKEVRALNLTTITRDRDDQGTEKVAA